MKKKIIYLMIMVIGVLGSTFLSHAAISSLERSALIALYNSTNGDYWHYNSGWKTPPLASDGFAMPGTEGNWYGISVIGNSVVQINLGGTDANPGNHLFGTIPPQIGNFTDLNTLVLHNNELYGSIPAQIGNLADLQYLYLGNNQLSGNIPSQIGYLNNLIVLNLWGNRLSGSIPTTIGNLNKIQYLYFNNNLLSGEIPTQFYNLNYLVKLNLSNNQLSGSIPTQLTTLLSIESLNLSSNYLTGSIPSQYGNGSRMKYLYLNNNLLSGEIPDIFTQFSSILGIDIGYNCVYTTNPTLAAWLNAKCPGWNSHQNQCSNPTATITILSPNGGENLSIGSTYIITWSTSGTINNIDIDYSINNGSTWTTIVSSITNTGYYNWTVPNKPSTTCKIRVRSAGYSSPSDTSNSVFTISNSQPPVMTLSRTHLYFSADTSGHVTSPQTVIIQNTGGGTINWNTLCSNVWLSCTPTSGNNYGVITVSVNTAGLTEGTYTGIISVSDPSLIINPVQSIIVTLKISGTGSTSAPFGDFASPVSGSTVSGSIPVTGWALDDIEVKKVEIYVGDVNLSQAAFVEGARPDVETAFPDYPMNSKAGWGYMLLTNFLPNGGNGTFTITAKVTDAEGNQTVLGSKTIICDNAHSIKPFGAIDTPSQGGTASGNSFVNFGWALTPQPKFINIDGSTINILIDGVTVGHPGYNLYREDIATLFPNYANTNGALGYYYLDTTKYSNGIHTIQWVVTDSGGIAEGIGSRYFTISNTDSDSPQNSLNGTSIEPLPIELLNNLDNLPSPSGKNNKTNQNTNQLQADITLNTKELHPLQFQIEKNISSVHGFMIVGNEYRPLPIGSTLDSKAGKFYWSPGPGFYGNYHLLFVMKDRDGQWVKKVININIE